MKYKLQQRINPQNPQGPKKYYAAPVNDGRVTKKEIAADIVKLSAMSRGDVSNVIESLIDTVPGYLLMNKSVGLDDLGTLRLSFSSEGVDTPEEFHVSMIKGLRVIFTPSSEFKAALTKIHYERQA